MSAGKSLLVSPHSRSRPIYSSLSKEQVPASRSVNCTAANSSIQPQSVSRVIQSGKRGRSASSAAALASAKVTPGSAMTSSGAVKVTRLKEYGSALSFPCGLMASSRLGSMLSREYSPSASR